MRPDHHPRFSWLGIGAAVLGIALVSGVEWGGTNDDVAPILETASAGRADSPFSDATPVAGNDAAAPAALATESVALAPPGSSGAPPGMTPEQWRQLNDALRDHPARDIEIARVASYMAFTARVDHFKTQRTVGASRATLQPIAQQLQVEVAERLARGELPLAEAEAVVNELLEVLEPDGAERDAALARWRTDHAVAAAPEQDPREADFLRRQAEAIESWQALPDDQRDPQELDAQLQALRNSLFATRP